MARWQGSTTQRGYGWSHVQERNRRLAAWRPGDPCARCGQPMWHKQRWSNGRLIAAIHLGHTADRTGYTGLEHDRCNEADGARRANAKQGMTRRWRTSRAW
jgi:hypothetical protein